MAGNPRLEKAGAALAKLADADGMEADEWLFSWVANGGRITQLAKKLDVSADTVYKLIKRFPEGEKRLAEARKESAPILADESLDLVDAIKRTAEGAEIRGVEVKSAQRLKLAALYDREAFGDKKGSVNLNLNIADMHLAALMQHGAAHVEAQQHEVRALPAPAEGPEDWEERG